MAQRSAASELAGEHGCKLGALKVLDQLMERARHFYSAVSSMISRVWRDPGKASARRRLMI